MGKHRMASMAASVTPPPVPAPSPWLEVLPGGADGRCYHMHGWLGLDQQRQIVAEVVGLAEGVQEDWVSRARAFDHPQIVCSYDKKPGKRANDCVRACGLRACSGACGRPNCSAEPTMLYSVVRDACEGARAAGLPGSVCFDPNSVWALLYKEGDEMPSHLDRAEGWTLSVSVGASVDFVLGEAPEKGTMYADYAPHKPHPGQEARRVVVESGDMLLFQGDRLFHGVEGTRPGTAPAWWLDGAERAETRDFARLGLLFRDGG
mmetsp:Transcript_31517/g.100499  ORF Transcript_31517/g.100499 Transcript_31517/m.100499 type:complete len:262 (+) Transcript_31517:2-787(+)